MLVQHTYPRFKKQLNLDLELVLASIRLIDKPKNAAEFHPVANENVAENIVNQFLSKQQQELIKNVWEKVGTVNIMRQFVDDDISNLTKEQQELLKLLNQKIRNNYDSIGFFTTLNETYNYLSLSFVPIDEVMNKSRYWETEFEPLHNCKNLSVEVLESIFLPPAPLGKYGFYWGDSNKLLLIKGYHHHYINIKNEYLYEFSVDENELLSQWYRMGIWHSVARNYWNNKLKDIEVEDFLKLPDNFRLKFYKSGHVLKPYENPKDYFLDHLTHATKVVAEQMMFGLENENAKINIRALYAWGMFYFDWFVENIRDYKSKNKDFINYLIESWKSEISNYQQLKLPFKGQIGACATPLWKKDISLVFSPSISNLTKRRIKIWFIQNWDITPTITDKLQENIGEIDTSKLVFALESDKEWLKDCTNYLIEKSNIDIKQDNIYQMSGVFLILTGNTNWIKVSVGNNEDELLMIHKNANFNYDYSIKINKEHYSGLY